MARAVTVAIPVLNGAEYLDEVLGAVRAQEVDLDVELLIVDSGSTDGSLEIAERHGARVHQIPKSDFSHGGTRNLMMELAEGDRVAFLTQDATPADEGWLAALLEGFDQADDVAAVFGPHVARDEASHVIKAEMKRHFENWGSGVAVDVQRLDRSPQGLAAYRAEPGKLTFLSSVNFMLRPALSSVPAAGVSPPLLRRVPRAARGARPSRAGEASSHRAGRARAGAPRSPLARRSGRERCSDAQSARPLATAPLREARRRGARLPGRPPTALGT